MNSFAYRCHHEFHPLPVHSTLTGATMNCVETFKANGELVAETIMENNLDVDYTRGGWVQDSNNESYIKQSVAMVRCPPLFHGFCHRGPPTTWLPGSAACLVLCGATSAVPELMLIVGAACLVLGTDRPWARFSNR